MMEYNFLQTPGLNQFWGSACLRVHTHTWMILHFFCVHIYKKNQPTDPYNFQAKRVNKPFIFLGLIYSNLNSLCSFLSYLQDHCSAQGEITGCCPVTSWQGELWVLRAGQNAAPSSCNHQSAGQGINHSTDHQLSQDEGLLKSGGPTMA